MEKNDSRTQHYDHANQHQLGQVARAHPQVSKSGVDHYTVNTFCKYNRRVGSVTIFKIGTRTSNITRRSLQERLRDKVTSQSLLRREYYMGESGSEYLVSWKLGSGHV